MKTPIALTNHVKEYKSIIAKYSKKLGDMYEKCYLNTVETALVPMDDDSIFVLTGDIPAMWLRDSTAEVSHYISSADDSEVAELIKRVIKRQRAYLLQDPYANAYKKEPDPKRIHDDYPINLPIVWERKYEIDSLCYPIRLTYLYYKKTGDHTVLDESFIKCAETTLDLWETEQHHMERSPYRFTRLNCKDSDTLHNDGLGNPVAYTGMTWSGFRPSDDACKYGYLVASNMFAVVSLEQLIEMLKAVKAPAELTERCAKLRNEIDEGIEKYAIVKHKDKNIYACEVDGNGNYFCFDDANVPSLLSAPYLGYCCKDDQLYKSTREFILSEDNPYFYKGTAAEGVGSPHTPDGYIWHIALSMQGLTSDDPDEIRRMLKYLETTDGGTLLMHEGFDANDPQKFTRAWFSWSCALFAELCEMAVNEKVI